MMRSRFNLASALAIGAITAAGFALSACSVSITADETPVDDASATAAPNASQAAEISQEVFSFCSLEARGSIDFIALLSDEAGAAIKDGIDQSIAQQQLTGADVDACIKGWVETLSLNGLTYDSATQTVTGTLTATSSNDAKLPEGVMDLTGDETGNAGS